MYNFNGSKQKKRAVALIALILIGAMVITTVVVGLFV